MGFCMGILGLVLAIKLVGFVFGLGFSIVGFLMKLLFWPFKIMGKIIASPFILVFFLLGLAFKLLPLALLGLGGYVVYQVIKEKTGKKWYE